MRVVFDSSIPAMFAHGGANIQVEQTKAALESIGVQVEYMQRGDKSQSGDLIHFIGNPSNLYLSLAKTAGLPVVITNLFTEACNRPDSRIIAQGCIIRFAMQLPIIRQVKDQLNWLIYANAAHNVVGLKCEKFVLEKSFHVPPERISVVPLGLSASFLNAGPGRRDQEHLVSTGTITARKGSVALAQLAHAAGVPILFVGKPYHPADPYWQQFQELVDGRIVKHHPHIESESEMASLLQSARGFVLMSLFENWCLSAHEAAACGLPLLIQRQKWSAERFGDQVSYFDRIGCNSANVTALKKFYADAPRLGPPKIKLYSWAEVAVELKKVYEKVLAH
jgi:glycosyltransferase involved in cell wall biosynthesis